MADKDLIPEELVPEELKGEIEKLVKGDGPFEDIEEARFIESEEPDEPQEDDRGDEIAELGARLSALEQAILNVSGVPEPILLPDQNVELGKTTAAFSSGATISVTPCIDDKTVTGEDAVTVFLRTDENIATVVIANDTVLKWERFDTRTPADVAGVLVGGFGGGTFMARIDNEDSGGGGEYDQWAEVEVDTETGGYKTLVGGRTHTTTSESLFESNGGIDIPNNTLVLVHIEGGDNVLYAFEYSRGFPQLEGGTVPSAVIPDVDKGWAYKYTRSGVDEIAHADPRDETVYKPPGNWFPNQCLVTYAFDARGHLIGWWKQDETWNSPWGFSDPGFPPPP